MFKFLIILSLFGLINSEATFDFKCFDQPILGGNGKYIGGLHVGQFYHHILNCAKVFTDELIDPDHPMKQCIWIDNLDYCTKTVFKNVDCGDEIERLIIDTIQELQDQGKRVPNCFRKARNRQSMKAAEETVNVIQYTNL